jgi:DNA helicase II / ATP-dependent DNA helicase PcrA
MGLELYAQYTTYLQARNGLDFDDLIWRATDALEQDPTFLLNLRARWPYILEDEAQDSSPLQEDILNRLAGAAGNWVRVGDPNQAINSTFTSADPRYLRSFAYQEGVRRPKPLDESGRCGRPIIALANHLVHWTCTAHPEEAVRAMTFEAQDIHPAPEGDRQPNPPDEECRVHFPEKPFSDLKVQADAVARSAGGYARRYPQRTVAVLCPTHWVGNDVVESLGKLAQPVPYEDLLRSTPQTRNVARVLAAACTYLGDPTQRTSLAALYDVLAQGGYLGVPQEVGDARRQVTLLRSAAPQKLLFPHAEDGLRDALPARVEVDARDAALFERFAALAARWVRALGLSVDQLLLTIAQDLFSAEADLAICHTIATSFRGTSDMHPEWRLAEFASELSEVARNQRSLGGMSLADAGYEAQPGHVVVTTMHKAKGLEWDAVYLISVDDLDFPSTCADAFRDEPYFMPQRAPALEARKSMERLVHSGFVADLNTTPMQEARLEFIAERLRLLYVGITRAKRYLAFAWCEKRAGNRNVRPAAAMLALRDAYNAYGLGEAR